MGYLLKKDWWKWLCVVLLVYTVIGGLLLPVPRLPILNETIRTLHFHVPMWFGMILLFVGSAIYAIKYLKTFNSKFDLYSSILANTGIAFGVLGMLTGMVWAKFTWGSPWSGDVKQNLSAVALLIYLAYFILRNSIKDDQQKSKISGVYNVFAFFMMLVLLFVLPRMTDSLHPGNGGNPGFTVYDMNSELRKVFYPAVAGWSLLGYWLATIAARLELTREKFENNN